MAGYGKLEKLLILAYEDSRKTEDGGLKEAVESFEVMINPETYTHEHKLKFSTDQGQGTSGTQGKYQKTEPEEITFDFLFDDTGIIDGKKHDGKEVNGKKNKLLSDEILAFKKMLVGYKGDAHEPRHFKLIWGKNSIFKGRVTVLSITYKLFRPDGTPIRATAKVTFKESVEEEKRAAKDNKSSPDLTHSRQVKLGDTLPLMCYQIYGDPRYYLDVARMNNLMDFRKLEPGKDLYFPPLKKSTERP